MGDLLHTLVLPNTSTFHPNSSQESFHSAKEQGGISIPLKSRQNRPAEQSHNQLDSQTSASTNLASASAHDSGQVYDVDAYLADPANVALLQSAASSAQHANYKEAESSNKEQRLQPVELGTQTSHYVSRLYEECQAKGLTPVFDIEGEADRATFGGVLRIGDATITLADQCGSKKKARERLAEKGVEVIKNMKAGMKEDSPAGVEGGTEKEVNWIGMLQEYHNLELGSAQPPVYTSNPLGSCYACTVIMPTYPGKTFGSSTEPFPKKKGAQRSAAAAAVRFLISEGKLNSDGSTLARKKNKLGSGRSVKLEADASGIKVVKETSYAQRIHDLAQMLGLNAPVYQLSPESMNAPNMLSGYVSFPDSPDLPKRIGEVRNVFGKKAAKEKAAKGAWEALLNLAEKRGIKLGGEVDF